MTRERTVAGFGAWESPIDIAMLTAGQVGLAEVAVDGQDLWWSESRADQGGRVSLWRRRGDDVTEMTPQANVRSGVHEYGGAAWAVRDGVLVYSTLPSHQCFVVRDGASTPLTPADARRYTCFEVHASLDLVLAVREDHTQSDLDCVNEIVALRLSSDNPDGGTVLVSGPDFVSGTTLSDDGRLAWIQWSHPDMPWDATQLCVATLDTESLTLGEATVVAGTATTAPMYPAWQGTDLLYFDEPEGFWNLTRYRDGVSETVVADHHDWCYPHWVFTHAIHPLADGRVACCRYVDGYEEIMVVSPDATVEHIPSDGVGFSLAAGGDTLLAVVAHADQPATIEVTHVDAPGWEVLRHSAETGLDASWFSVAQPVSWASDAGPVYAWYYPPTNPDFEAPEGELPPLKVLSHGGPTGFASPALDLKRQYWTSRGWAILDVNYGGSACYGRAYRERLHATWGLRDVVDCAEGAQAMVNEGRADPARLAIEGGSAGGYTTLAALTSTDVFTAGNCLYGIGDLNVLITDTHKFESRYPYRLMGGTPDEVPEVYRDRSPINHLDRLSCPMLIQQGAEDRVVPPNQATLMADAVRAKGLPVALLMFDGEGHGFRRAETIKTSVESALSFFGQVFGYQPVGVPTIEVENLERTRD